MSPEERPPSVQAWDEAVRRFASRPEVVKAAGDALEAEVLRLSALLGAVQDRVASASVARPALIDIGIMLHKAECGQK